jgi:hypothetical protein
LPIESSAELLLVNTGSGKNRYTRMLPRKNGTVACVPGAGEHCSRPFWTEKAGEFVLSPLVSALHLEMNAGDVGVSRLDESGHPGGSVAVTRTQDGYRLVLDGHTDRTPWYRVELAR